jgi:hypothetical protein
MIGHVVEDEEQRRWFMENLERHVEADQTRKFAALYVDVASGGAVTAPKEVIDSDSAKAVAYVLGTLIRSQADMWRGVNFHDLFREVGGSRRVPPRPSVPRLRPCGADRRVLGPSREAHSEPCKEVEAGGAGGCGWRPVGMVPPVSCRPTRTVAAGTCGKRPVESGTTDLFSQPRLVVECR